MKSIGPEAGHISDLTAQISALEGKADEMHDEGLSACFGPKPPAATGSVFSSAMKSMTIWKRSSIGSTTWRT